MRLVVAIFLSNIAIASYADDNWAWSEKIAISAPPQDGVFHHLDGSGRKHIAVSKDKIAVVWEDDSSGSPQIYIASKSFDQTIFTQPVKLSAGVEAYEPTVAALGSSSFITAYEEDGVVYARLLSDNGPSQAIQISSSKVSQASSVSMTSRNNHAYLVWREKFQRKYQLAVTEIRLQDDNQLIVGNANTLESDALETPVLKPSIIATENWIYIAWEDRRAGHTRLLYSYSALPDMKFSEPENLNEFYSNRNEYDKGNGVTRLAMSAFGDDEILAAWMDKRRGGGYGIFSSLGSASDQSFGPNEKVHDNRGDRSPHYNPAVSGNATGDFIVVWDDYRNGDLDIWLSNYNDDDEWSRDFSPGVASGPGEQSHASVVLDNNKGLHLVWIDRKENLSPTQLWYSHAVAK